MEITTDHPGSSYGLPVILDDAGNLMDERAGLKAVLKKLGWTLGDLARATGKSISSCQKYGRDATIPAEVLNVLAEELKKVN